jgi:hypothetical protein
MAKNRYDPKSIDELMGKWSNKITQFGAKTDSLQVLQAELDKALGPILCKKCRVANYRDGTLIIEAASATLATRLNYLKLDILSHLRKNGFAECGQVKVASNPDAQLRLSEPKASLKPQKSGRTMSEDTAAQLTELAQYAPPSLQAKLLKLATHATKNRQKK